MIIAGLYNFNHGMEVVRSKYPSMLAEIEEIITGIDAEAHRTKVSREKTMPGRMLFDPTTLNITFSEAFAARGWHKQRVKSVYPTTFYTPNYQPRKMRGGAFREMDFVKEKLGVEVQFGKYAFMVYNVCAKMTIFNKLGYIDTGVEIVPIKQFADDMSTGVSYFEQFVWDLEQRGVSDIDIPVLIIGVDADQPTKLEEFSEQYRMEIL